MNITVYLGANEGNDPFFKEAVRELGAWIGTNGNTLVYGGSKSGLMGELAESVLQAGGKVIGVEPQFFIDAGFVYDEITELITTKDMSERKAKMIELGDAFIAFPGGTGTLEEITEVMSKVSLKHLDAPCILYNLNGYYDSLKQLLDHMIKMGLSSENRQQGIYFADDMEDIKALLLMASGITDSSLKYHLQNAKNHGVTQKEIAAVITHAAFYAGWPKAWAVFNLAKEVWETGEGDLPYEEEAMRAHAKEMVFPIGAPNDGFAQYFSGRSFLAPISTSQVGIFNVTFEPGCRNNWHIHHAKSGGGQILVCVAGRGFYQEEGRDAVEMKPGDCINIPVDVKHWHGAAPDEWFSHLAIEVPGVDCSNEWCEAVSEKEYAGLR